jgi:SP family general alpha glucoside:H+ symporter-like MFS transporter
MSFIEGCRLYPKAIAWSVLLTATIIMEGFDLALVSSFQAFPIFRQTYGKPAGANGDNHQISPPWQTAIQDGAVAGEILGLLINGWMTDRFGYQRTMLITLIWMCLFVFLAFFAFNIEMLLASQVLCGIPWGIFQTLSMTYASEVMPLVLRSYLLSNVNMCWLIGQITAVSILRGFIHLNSEWSFRIPFALQWAFAVPILSETDPSYSDHSPLTFYF